jgi:hypothetical protein
MGKRQRRSGILWLAIGRGQINPLDLHGSNLWTVLLFLEHSLRHFQAQVSDNADHFFHCNDLGLLQRIGHDMDLSSCNPNHCLASECDLFSNAHQLSSPMITSKAIKMANPN